MQRTLEDQTLSWQEPQRQYQWWSELHKLFLPERLQKKITNPIQPCETCDIHEGRKCCNFFPQFANFMVGAILENSSSMAKETIKSLIEKGEGVTPFGVHPTEQWKKALKPTCPFLHQGSCTTWQNRPGECASFFCRGSRGNAKLLFEIECAISQWSLLQLGYDNSEIEMLLESWNAQDKKGAKMWEHWSGKPIEFYEEAWKIAKSLTPEHEVIKEVLCSTKDLKN